METDRGKSLPGVKEFQIDSSWAPVTPAKPTLPKPRPIYADEQEIRPSQAFTVESEDYILRFSEQDHQPQRLVSCTVSSAEASNSSSWDARKGESFLANGSFNLPHWSSESRRTAPFPGYDLANFGQRDSGYNQHWEEEVLPDRLGSLNQNAGLPEGSSDDPLSQYYQFGFRDLLGMNNAGFMPSINGMSLGIGGASGGDHISELNAPHEGSRLSVKLGTSFLQDYGLLHQSSQQSRVNYAPQMQHSGVPHDLWSMFDSRMPVSMQNSLTNGNRSVLAPATPDHCRRLDSDLPSEGTGSHTGQNTNEQNMQQENEVAGTRFDLEVLHNKETMPGSGLSQGTASALMENHSPDKGSNNGIDLNRTPQQKPRRKKHRPKVISEDKPKQKPRNPKPTDPKEIPRVKRKYVRKNKTNPPSTTPPAETPEAPDPNVQNHLLKSCRRSLNFELDSQLKEDSCLDRSNCNCSSEPQANQLYTAGTQSKQTVHLGKAQEVTVEMTQAGTAYDLSRATNQMLKDYMTLPQEETPSTPHLAKPTTPSQEKGKAIAEYENNTQRNIHAATSMEGCSRKQNFGADSLWAYSGNSSTCGSSNGGEQPLGSKRAFPFVVGEADVNTGNLGATPSAFYSSNHQLLGNGNINRMANVLFPEICKKKRTEKVCRVNTTCASSSTVSEDATQTITDQNCLGGTAIGSRYYYCNPSPQLNTSTALNNLAEAAGGSVGNRMPFIHKWTDIEKLKRKRSKGPIRARNCASLTGFVESKELPILPGKKPAKNGRKKKENVLNAPDAFMETLAADTRGAKTTKKRSKKRNSASSSFAMNMQLDLIVYRNHQSARNSSGPLLALPWEDMMSIDTITAGLQQMDINTESSTLRLIEQKALIPYHANRQIEANFSQGENALVLYGKDGTIVPFEGPVRKRRERAKVDLDDETNRVWKLLLENINNEGINGTDEEKAKWWEEERRVFHGRVDSFIARMRLVQGDRRFTPWKGSVVDSVIGVFLTQNVSDHLSSSAFMSLAAHFPLKCQGKPQYEGTTVVVEEPEDCKLDLEDIDTCSGKMLDEPVCDRSSRTLLDIDHGEEKEVVNSKELLERSPCVVSPKDNTSGCINAIESGDKMPYELRVPSGGIHIIDTETASTSGETRMMDDITSSQHSVLSSQTSVDSASAPTWGMIGSCSESNSEAEDLTTSSNPYFDHPTSFVELLKMAEAPKQLEASIHKDDPITSYREQLNKPGELKHDKEGKGAFGAELPKSSLEEPNVSNNNHLRLKTNSQLHVANFIEIIDEESRSSNDSTRKDDKCTTEQSELTTESIIQSPSQEKISEAMLTPENLCSCYVLEGERMVMQSHIWVRDPKDIANSSSQETLMQKENNVPTGAMAGVSQNTSPFYDKRKNNGHVNTEQNSPHDHASGEMYNMVKSDTAKQRKARVGKGKKTETDWDSLRKQAQDNGKKRERTANTMDSLDYEAVRCADVSEVADTIKERGMNNMLAERIKDFLNRLVSEHGSIDLEWLRDVPPDKAKEYLLSIRGLGLKSVECVRLLTLHHLAFPVDTNVGRIAVRLGWVPLQPLPESLQLHLLELYPVLESIQKYLWPRLCKLDQRTLYELHYHMITFGKVFCTKRQPNCNACPLRGECRHFASAFASARLALPGPEERSILASTHCGVANQDPQVTINTFALTVPQAHQLSETKLEITNCEPIIEVPASPEPELLQTLECDIEDTYYEDLNEIPTIKLNMEQFTQTLQTYMQANKELQPADMSKALVALTAEAASIPTPKLKNVSRLRTEHHVYELPDTHPLLEGLDNREPDDPCSYLLAIWTPGETANSIQPPERKCNCQEPGELCEDETCFYCNSQREANSQIVRGTLLIPCRTAMRGSFPLNGTYFQVNEVFADHHSSLNPIAVPRDWLWNLPRRTVYFGTSIPTIMRGLSTEGIQHCFWRGYVCVRGFDQKTRAPRPLMARLHFPASKMTKSKGKTNGFSIQQDD
ncbi:hypothetical protein Ancab_014320 [Ancistrocladus abbreviatus]